MAELWLAWACDEDAETIWIREDLARTDDIAAVQGPGHKAGLAECIGLGQVWPHLRLIFDCLEPMVVVNLADTGWGEDSLGIWAAHPDEDGDVMLYRRYYATEDQPEPGDVVFGATS